MSVKLLANKTTTGEKGERRAEKRRETGSQEYNQSQLCWDVGYKSQ